MWQNSVALSLSNHITVQSLRAEAAGIKQTQGSREGSTSTQVSPLPVRFKVPAMRSQSFGEACCWSSCHGNHRQLFQGYAHWSSHCGDVLLRFGPPHKPSLHTHTHTPTTICAGISTDIHEDWHWADIVKNDLWKGVFLTLFRCRWLLPTPSPVHME